MQSHRQHARKRARTAQLAAGGGLAAALAVAVLPLHAALTRSAEPPAPPPTADNTTDEGPAAEPIDRQWASNIFLAVSPAAIPATTGEGVTIAEPTPEPVPQSPNDPGNIVPNARWQYLGSIATGRGRSAILRDTQTGNRQHLVFEGKEVDGFKVTEITSSHVILSGSGGQTQVDLAPVSSSWTAPGAAAPVRAAAVAPGQQRPNPRVNPAVANRTRAGRTKGELDPEVMKQIREQVLTGDMDMERLAMLRKSGVLDEATAEELSMQFKEMQGLSEEEYAEMREKLSQ